MAAEGGAPLLCSSAATWARRARALGYEPTAESGTRWWWGSQPADSPGKVQLFSEPDLRQLSGFREVDEELMMKRDDGAVPGARSVPRMSMRAPPSIVGVLTGLRNLGNSCWLSSGCQCAYNC